MKDMRKVRYCSIKNSCKNRVDAAGNPIEFRLTFDEWWDIWEASGKYHLCGKRRGQYCMSRVNDIGHYEVGNVFIQLHSENNSQAHKGRIMGPASEERKQKVSAANKGIPKSEAWKQQHSAVMKGRTLSVEHKQKLSAASKGRKQSPEHIAKRLATTKANGTDNTGRVWPKEVIAKREATRKANAEKRKQENR
jgi:hypothetical protein